MGTQKSVDLSAIGSNRGRSTRFATEMNLTAPQFRKADPVLRGWRSGPLSHLTRLTALRTAPHGFRLSADGHHYNGLLSIRFYSDSLAGVSGRGVDQDPIVVDLVNSGGLEFRKGGESYAVMPGQICIRDTKSPWDFSCAPATRVRMVAITRHALIPRIDSPEKLNRPYIGEAASPRLLFW